MSPCPAEGKPAWRHGPLRWGFFSPIGRDSFAPRWTGASAGPAPSWRRPTSASCSAGAKPTCLRKPSGCWRTCGETGRRASRSVPSTTPPWNAGSPPGRRRVRPASPSTPTCPPAGGSALWDRILTRRATWPPAFSTSASLATAGNLKFDGHRRRLEELGFPAGQILVRETFNDYETTRRVVRETLEEQPELRGVYMANLSVSGCCAALAQAEKTGQVHVVCHDVNAGIRQLIRSGAVDFTIPQDLESQGYAPLLLLRDHLRKRTVPGNLPGRIQILCAENLD